MTSGSGVLENGVHVFPVRVYYEDTDAGGVVYHANYLRFAERARTEMMRLLGMEHSALLAREGLLFTVRRCEADYRAPARLDDRLEVRSRIVEAGGASLDVEQVVARAGTDLVRLLLRLACVTREGRPARLPNALRTALKRLKQAE
jgi:acyl-CoA thioester hydrolase